MNNYQPDTYDIILDHLQPLISNRQLDNVSVASMIRSSVEIADDQLPSATRSVAYKGKYYTIKLSNIKINFSFALKIIFKFQAILTQKKLGLIMALIDMVQFLLTSSTKELTSDLAVVLFSVYRIHTGNSERIKSYVQELELSEAEKPKSDQIDRLLHVLTELKCISCIDGNYTINEVVDCSMIRQFS